MKYEGPIYGKIAGKYVKLTGSSADVDQLEKDLETTRQQLSIAREALEKIDKAALSNAWKKKIAREALSAIAKEGDS